MNSDFDDKKFSQLFHELRAADERQTPPFESLLGQPPARRPVQPDRGVCKTLWLLPASAFCAVLIAVFFWASMLSNPRASRPDRTAKESAHPPALNSPDIFWLSGDLIARWKSPTAFLLTSASPSQGTLSGSDFLEGLTGFSVPANN